MNQWSSLYLPVLVLAVVCVFIGMKDLSKTSKKPRLLSAVAIGVVVFLVFNIIMKMESGYTKRNHQKHWITVRLRDSVPSS